MDAYDPNGDPRHIPVYDPDEIRRQEAADLAERAIRRADDAIRRFDEMQEMFGTPGWAHYVAIVEENVEVLERHLNEETDQSKWSVLRGQLAMARFVLDIPTQAAKALDKLNGQRQELARLVEGEG